MSRVPRWVRVPGPGCCSVLSWCWPVACGRRACRSSSGVHPGGPEAGGGAAAVWLRNSPCSWGAWPGDGHPGAGAGWPAPAACLCALPCTTSLLRTASFRPQHPFRAQPPSRPQCFSCAQRFSCRQRAARAHSVPSARSALLPDSVCPLLEVGWWSGSAGLGGCLGPCQRGGVRGQAGDDVFEGKVPAQKQHLDQGPGAVPLAVDLLGLGPPGVMDGCEPACRAGLFEGAEPGKAPGLQARALRAVVQIQADGALAPRRSGRATSTFWFVNDRVTSVRYGPNLFADQPDRG